MSTSINRYRVQPVALLLIELVRGQRYLSGRSTWSLILQAKVVSNVNDI